jgi:hypothetical protein
MTSDVGILKIGIADDPLIRMKMVNKVYPVITGFYQAWGMPRRQAEFVERMVHRRLASFRHKNELFTMTEPRAAAEIETVIRTLGLTASRFDPSPLPPPKPPNVPKKLGRPKGPPRSMLSFRLDLELRREAESAAKAVQRSLTNWINHLIACELASLGRGEPPARIVR